MDIVTIQRRRNLKKKQTITFIIELCQSESIKNE